MAKKDDAVQHNPDWVGVEDQLDAIGVGRIQYIALLAAFLFIVSDGMELIVTNITFRALPKTEWGMDDSYRGTLISTSFVGFVVGGLLGGYFGDMIGRRTMLFVHSAVFLPFTIMSGLSQSLEMLLVSRLFVGTSMGIVLPTAVSYISELSPTQLRGRFVSSLPCIGFAVGEVIVLLVGVAFMLQFKEENCDSGGCSWWRVMMVAGTIPDIIALILTYCYLPESPRFLLMHGRHDEVEKAIKYIAEVNNAKGKLLNNGRVTPISTVVEPGVRFAELFVPPIRDNLVLIIIVWCLLAVPLFGQSFLYPIILEKQFNVGAVEQFMQMIPFVSMDIVGLVISFYFIDNPDFGRKRTIAIFSIAAALAAIVSSLFAGADLATVHFCNLTFKIFVAVPYAVMYVYAAELLPTTHRNQGISIGNSSTKLIGGVLLPLAITAMISASGPVMAQQYFLYVCAISSMMAMGYIMMMGRETVGRLMVDSSVEIVENGDTAYRPIE